MNIKERIKQLDEQYKDLPRKIFLVLAVLISSFFGKGGTLCAAFYYRLYIFAYTYMPKPSFSRLLSKIKPKQKLAVVLSMLLLYGLLGFLISLLQSRFM